MTRASTLALLLIAPAGAGAGTAIGRITVASSDDAAVSALAGSAERQVKRALVTARRAEKRARTARAAALRVKRGPTGATGPAGAPGAPGAQGAAGQTGQPGPSTVDGDIPSGVTLTGHWYGELRRQNAGSYTIVVSLPARAPAPLGDENVGFPTGTTLGAGDELPTRCAPAAGPPLSPGFVCLYLDAAASVNVSALTGEALDPAAPHPPGFTVRAVERSRGSTDHPDPGWRDLDVHRALIAAE